MRKLKPLTIATFLALLLALNACATLQKMVQFNDPVKVALYSAKEVYEKARETAVINNSKQILSDRDFASFWANDEKVEAKYKEALKLYRAGKPIAQKVLDDLTKLSDDAKALAEKVSAGGK